MKAKEAKATLEEMIQAAENHISQNVPVPGDIPEEISVSSFEIDYGELEKKCDRQAKKLLKNATGFVMGDEMISGNPYIKEKIKTDLISLSGMLYQMEITKIMQKDLIEEVRLGSKHPRMYEVFSTLGKVISENNKQLLQTVEAIKETYINMRNNIIERNDSVKALPPSDTPIMISMGSRDLINEAKRLKLEARNLPSDISDARVENL